MRHLYCRTVEPNHNCQAPTLYQPGCCSNGWCEITEKIDLRPYLLSPVLDQGLLNSCSGCALSAAVEITLNREQDHFFECGNGSKASAMFIYYYERLLSNKELENTPVYLDDGFTVLTSFGVCCAELWPYPETSVPQSLWQLAKDGTLEEITQEMSRILQEKESLIKSLLEQKPSDEAKVQAKEFNNIKYTQLSIENGMNEIKHALSNKTPIVFGFIEPQSFFDIAANGEMPMPAEDELRIGGHAVCAVGFDDEKQAILIRNSYGKDFGIDGYCYMPYEFILGQYTDAEGNKHPNAFNFYCILEEGNN